jgi:hypothetical protein
MTLRMPTTVQSRCRSQLDVTLSTIHSEKRLVKTRGQLIKHARYYWLLLSERPSDASAVRGDRAKDCQFTGDEGFELFVSDIKTSREEMQTRRTKRRWLVYTRPCWGAQNGNPSSKLVEEAPRLRTRSAASAKPATIGFIAAATHGLLLAMPRRLSSDTTVRKWPTADPCIQRGGKRGTILGSILDPIDRHPRGHGAGGECSGGEQPRCALRVAFLNTPAATTLVEPTRRQLITNQENSVCSTMDVISYWQRLYSRSIPYRRSKTPA